MKGIVLAGGSGTRLAPITNGISKQLMPVYNKPMIYYPISILMNAGIRDILIISTEADLPGFQRLLGSGDKFGVNFQYKVQPEPKGIAQAFIIGEEFIGDDSVCLVLGDNIFHGSGFTELIKDSRKRVEKYNEPIIFNKYVFNPSRFGIVEYNNYDKIISIEEKPHKPKSNYAVTGLYMYPNDVIEVAKTLKPSKRGELEITDINKHYLDEDRLQHIKLKYSCEWFDTGTVKSIYDATRYVMNEETRNNKMIGCLEEIAYENKWISLEQLNELGTQMSNSEYGKYLLDLVPEGNQYIYNVTIK